MQKSSKLKREKKESIEIESEIKGYLYETETEFNQSKKWAKRRNKKQ